MKKHNFFIKKEREGKKYSGGSHSNVWINGQKFLAIQTNAEI